MSNVLIGMSGGVDSSVAVHRLKEAGHNVYGIYLKLTPESGRDDQAEQDARAIAEKLGVQLFVADERQLFSTVIIDAFAKAYAEGLTPNPCIYCNAQVKFHLLFHYARNLGCDKVATGHYARIVNESGTYSLAKGLDPKKDQSYFLSQLPATYLPHILFPIGDLTKDQVRKMAEDLDLPIAHKKDSQEICFIPNDDYIHFLEKEFKDQLPNTGVFKDQNGKTLGKHQGSYHYTIGQRKGLGLALGYPAYVTGIDAKKGIITIGKDMELWHQKLRAEEVNYFSPLGELPIEGEAIAKIRSRDQGEPAHYLFDGENLFVTFEKPVRAITPGQSVVLYRDDKIIAGAIIQNYIE